jgi:hypothetical protein
MAPMALVVPMGCQALCRLHPLGRKGHRHPLPWYRVAVPKALRPALRGSGKREMSGAPRGRSPDTGSIPNHPGSSETAVARRSAGRSTRYRLRVIKRQRSDATLYNLALSNRVGGQALIQRFVPPLQCVVPPLIRSTAQRSSLLTHVQIRATI